MYGFFERMIRQGRVPDIGKPGESKVEQIQRKDATPDEDLMYSQAPEVYNNSKLETIVYLANEHFKEYSRNSDYMVGNKGTVYDKIHGCRLHQIISGGGYANYSIRGRGPEMAHRMVMETFVGIPEQGMVCNHINGVKTDNRLENLEWITQNENMNHAYRTGLAPSGENRYNAIRTDEQIRSICEMMQARMTNIQIADVLRIEDPKERYEFFRLCYNIRTRNQWAHVSKEYDIPLVHHHDDDEIHTICQLIVMNKSNKEIASIMAKDFGIDISEGYIRILRYCNPIYQPKEWEIVKHYKDKFPDRSMANYSEQTIEYFCGLMEKGLKPKEIAEKLAIEDNKSFRRVLSQLRQGRIYKNIVAKYPGLKTINARKITPDEVYKILEMKFIEGMKSPQIAEKLGFEFNKSFATKVHQMSTGTTFPEVFTKFLDEHPELSFKYPALFAGR